MYLIKSNIWGVTVNPFEKLKQEASSLTSSFSECIGDNDAANKSTNELLPTLRNYFTNAVILISSDGSVLINTPQFGDEFPYRCIRYYEAEDFLLNTRRGIVSLVGVRRTGKTIIMHQLWSKVHTNHSYFITADVTISIDALKLLVLYTDIDFLFIDEATRLDGL